MLASLFRFTDNSFESQVSAYWEILELKFVFGKFRLAPVTFKFTPLLRFRLLSIFLYFEFCCGAPSFCCWLTVFSHLLIDGWFLVPCSRIAFLLVLYLAELLVFGRIFDKLNFLLN